MKTVVVLACLVIALAEANWVPPKTVYKTKAVEQDFVDKQKLILELFLHPQQVDVEAKYYKVGKDYKIEDHVDDYTNKKAVHDFLELWKTGFQPRNIPFSVFYERQRDEAVALFHLFYYAKDFTTFYNTASYARVYLNEGQFLYAYYIALFHRADTKDIVVPAPYEVYPQLFTNSNVWYKIFSTKMQNGDFTPDFGTEQGIVKDGDRWVVYSNYSNYLSYPDEEYKISYFTEDIGLNAYYYYFNTYFPFWMNDDVYPAIKTRRGEIFYYFYQQLLARYYLERLSHGLGEIPRFSWWHPIKTGYRPNVNYYLENFVQRNPHYNVPYDKEYEALQDVSTYEYTFTQYLRMKQIKSFNYDVDFHKSKSVNFVGNFWFGYNLSTSFHKDSYEITARHILGAAPKSVNKYTVVPAALDFYQTSLRDPIFYQLYARILNQFVEAKKFIKPYTQDDLHYVGVKINDVKLDKLVTYFDYYDFDVTNNVYLTKEELTTKKYTPFFVRQPRLNHKPFTVTVEVKSDVESDAVFKVFMGPKYDSKGYPIELENNWENFVELDWFVHKLTKGVNKVERVSNDFYFYKEDSVPLRDIFSILSENKVPSDMSVQSGAFPHRLVLPKGTKGGFPYQFFVMVYPYTPSDNKIDAIKTFELDSKPLGYPFDRPVSEVYFKQPNMYFEDVVVYHEGEEFTYSYNTPYYTIHHNEVTKH